MFNPNIYLGYKIPNGLVNRCDISVLNNREPFNQVASMTVLIRWQSQDIPNPSHLVKGLFILIWEDLINDNLKIVII